jgi:glycosyltransferase involved in cell wall biosynthesis
MTMDRQPSKILLVAPSPPPYGGMALQARLLERLLRQDGMDIDFFASNFHFPRGLQFADRIPGFRTAVRFVLTWILLWNRVRDVQVVHIFAASWLYFFAVVWPAVLISRLRDKRVVLNYRGGEAARFFRSFGTAAGPALRLATVITTPSEFLSGIIRKRFNVPVAIVPNILDLSRFTHTRRAFFKPRILVTRHLEAMYDIASVLRAFARIQKRYPAASLLIAGTGSQEHALRTLAAELNVDNVTFLGHVPQDQLPVIHASCDILVNASRVDNFPGALVEASASGLAVVSTCAGGIPYIYKDGVTALLVEPGDWEGLATAVERILQSPALGVNLTTAALDLANDCDWNQVCRKLYAAYGFSPDFRHKAGDAQMAAAGNSEL